MASSSAASGSCAGLPRESKAAPSTEDTPAETRNLENTQNKAAVQVQVDGSLNASPQGFASRTVLNAEDDAIDEALPILPKGFVENTAEIYSEVASFDVIPAEKLREYWRVYTITHRRLYDPTANRLENFWWHVWGSKRRDLSGATVARLYKNISLGPTFVPLRTPTSRYEGPSIPSYMLLPPPQHIEPIEEQPKAGERKQDATTEDRGRSGSATKVNDILREISTPRDDSSQQEAQLKILSSSSSRPPPAQSILRKARPSLSGPRPTPRFTLPDSAAQPEDEDNHSNASISDGAVTSSVGSGSVSGAEINVTQATRSSTASSTADHEKPAPAHRDGRRPSKSKLAKKKFVVSSSASKRRTVLSKRTSSTGSHSSVGSEGPSTRDGLLHLSPRLSESPVVEEEAQDSEYFSMASASSGQQQQSQVLPQSEVPPTMTEKAAGKQPEQRPFLGRQEEVVRQVATTTNGFMGGGAGPAAKAKPIVSEQRASLAQQIPNLAAYSGSLASSGGSSTLEMPMVPPKKLPTQKPSQTSRDLFPPTSSGLRQNTTVPYGLRQPELGQASSSAATTPRPPVRMAPTSAYMGLGPSTGIPPRLMASVTSAPRMSRSQSQDSYGPRLRSERDLYQAPSLAGPDMRAATTAAPSMVDANGEFLDPEGPDTFEMFARTGLDQALFEEIQDRGPPSAMFRGGSYSSSYQDMQSLQRPHFTPTRPTQTPRIPFARTRSQLNIILGREKERLGEGNYASWQEARARRDSNESQRKEERGTPE